MCGSEGERSIHRAVLHGNAAPLSSGSAGHPAESGCRSGGGLIGTSSRQIGELLGLEGLARTESQSFRKPFESLSTLILCKLSNLY